MKRLFEAIDHLRSAESPSPELLAVFEARAGARRDRTMQWWYGYLAGAGGMAVAAFAAVTIACSGATAHTRSAYAVEVTRCIANERALVDRQGTTLEQDRADLRAERERCDAALAAIGGP